MSAVGDPDSPAVGLTQTEAAELELAGGKVLADPSVHDLPGQASGDRVELRTSACEEAMRDCERLAGAL
jgi:hypothetical protein